MDKQPISNNPLVQILINEPKRKIPQTQKYKVK